MAIFLHLEPLSGVSVYVARERGLSLQKTIRPASVAQPYPGATAGGGNSQNISFNGIMTGTTTFFNQFAAQIARTQQQYAQLNPSLT